MRKFFTILFVILVVAGCKHAPKRVVKLYSYDQVEQKVEEYKEKEQYALAESYIQKMLMKDWTKDESDSIKIMLAEMFYKQQEYENVLSTLEHVKKNKKCIKESYLLFSAASFELKKYDQTLNHLLQIYLMLSSEEKIDASKKIFFSYLYTQRTEQAAQWFSRLNNEKRTAIAPDLATYFVENPEQEDAFETFLKQQPEGGSLEDLDALKSPELVEVEEKEDVFTIDESIVPDFDKICLFLSQESQWEKVNEVVESYLKWHFQDFAQTDITPVIYRYLTEEDIETGFIQAKDENCAAIFGPLFTDDFADDFEQLSKTHKIPVFAYTSYLSSGDGLLYNFKYTSDREIDDVLDFMREQGKERFAIIFPQDFRGKTLRDLYIQKIEKFGGVVTDMIGYAPGRKSFIDLVGEMLQAPEDLNEVIKKFKEENKDTYKNESLLNRALNKFLKKVPVAADFDVVFVLGNRVQSNLIIPAFAYNNLEFDYKSKLERTRIENNQKELEDEKLEWEYDTVMVVPQSHVKIDKEFQKNIGKFIDGMVLAAREATFSDSYNKLVNIFKKKHDRDIYPIEIYLAEIASIYLQAIEKSGRINLAAFVDVLKQGKFDSYFLDREVYFNDRNQQAGNSTIYFGRKRKGFLSKAELEEKEEKKKNKSGKNKKK